MWVPTRLEFAKSLWEGGTHLDPVLDQGSHRLDTLSNILSAQAALETAFARSYSGDVVFRPKEPDYNRCKLASHISYDKTRSCLKVDESLATILCELVRVRDPFRRYTQALTIYKHCIEV